MCHRRAHVWQWTFTKWTFFHRIFHSESIIMTTFPCCESKILVFKRDQRNMTCSDLLNTIIKRDAFRKSFAPLKLSSLTVKPTLLMLSLIWLDLMAGKGRILSEAHAWGSNSVSVPSSMLKSTGAPWEIPDFSSGSSAFVSLSFLQHKCISLIWAQPVCVILHGNIELMPDTVYKHFCVFINAKDWCTDWWNVYLECNVRLLWI